VSRRAVFLDRDGVINMKPPAGDYVRSWAEFRFVPTIAGWIRLFNALDLLVIVVTNQRGIARGLTSQETVDEIHRNMLAELARGGARIDDIFHCPHDRHHDCRCRKPRPGMVEQAQRKWDIDLPNSLMIGDSDKDAELAANCGMKFLRVDEGRFVQD
jgi:D-glycero-D-manno-heptose 1,7-bisphosphate phosphatase